MPRSTQEWEAHVGEQIRAERIRRSMDQRALAEAANISVSSLSGLENGGGTRLATLIKVVRALNKEEWLGELAPLSSISPLAMLRDKDRTTPRQRAPRTRASAQGGV